MTQKYLIVLLVAIFYNGVVYASPLNEQHSAAILPEEKPPTNSPVTIDQKKVEPTHASIPDHSTPVTQKSAAPLDHTAIPVVKNITTHPDANKLITPPHIIDSKNVTSDHNSKNATSVIDNNKNPTLVPSVKNISQPIDNKTTITTEGTKNVSVPVEVPSVTNSTALPSSHASQNVSKPVTVSPATTTLKINSTKAEVTTIAPNSTSSDKVLVQNVPTPGQEKNFDGPSFIGGIILTIGLTAIGFIAFKYYKSGKIDMNYRTL